MYLVTGTNLYQVVHITSANTQENVACVSSVAGVKLKILANRAIRTDVSITNQNMNNAAGPYKGIFGQQILRLKIWGLDYHSNDDVSAISDSDSDSDSLETVEKADVVEFLDDITGTGSSTSAGRSSNQRT